MPTVPNSPDAPQRRPLARRAPSVPIETRVDRLERRLEAMADQVVTRRLVVVDNFGRERIIGSTMDGDHSATLKVQSPIGNDNVQLVSMSPYEDEFHSELSLVADGDAAGFLSSSPAAGHHTNREAMLSLGVDRPTELTARWWAK